jgi:hypothetical protein
MYYWTWKAEHNQFYYDYNKTMAEMAAQGGSSVDEDE